MTEISRIPASPTEQLAAMRQEAGVATLAAGWIAVRGGDRVRWLNGMVTNSVQALTAGEGAYSFLLSAQGRIQGDLTVWAETEQLLLQTAPQQVQTILDLLDRFIIMDDVELADVSSGWHGVEVVGPKAVEMLSAAGLSTRTSRLLKRQSLQWMDQPLTLIHGYSPVLPRFEVWSENDQDIERLRDLLVEASTVVCDSAGIELLRILEGTPRLGTDIRGRDLPQETAQTRALHFNKGCYLGQEIVERIRSRGNVHRTFTTFSLTGDMAAPGTALESEGKPAGELTSIGSEIIEGKRLALGFVRREALDRGSVITCAGGVAEPAGAPRVASAAS